MKFTNTNKSNSIINGGNGNDHIYNGDKWYHYNYGAEYITMFGGLGNDYLWNDRSYVLMDGGDENDTLTHYTDSSNAGKSVTMIGGKGDDLIFINGSAQGDLVQYSNGDGNDTIYGYKAVDTITKMR